MSARETKIRSLDWIARIRHAQRRDAEFRAADALRAADNAEGSRMAAQQQCDDALAAWFLVTGEQRFDPALASTWARALSGHDATLAAACAAVVDIEDACRKYHAEWQASVVRAGHASENVAAARRRARLYHEEKGLAERADLTALGMLGR